MIVFLETLEKIERQLNVSVLSSSRSDGENH